MRIAYLINQYPMVSHTFIRREIQALERQGFDIVRISLRGWDETLVDPEDLRERDRTQFVLREGLSAVLFALTRMLLTRPIDFLRALALAYRIGRASDRPKYLHLAYLAEACWIFYWLRRSEVQHVHAHFSSNSAEVAMLLHALGGPSWSFTSHGVASLENPRLAGLVEKVRLCRFVVAICSFTRGQLFRYIPASNWPKVHVVHCGLDPRFYAAPASAAPPSRRFACVGRLSLEKAQVLLLEAARQLAEQGVDFELVLAGDGPLRPDIEALISRHNLDGQVRMTGWITGDQVREELLAARALVLPSLAEGLPVVIMEAMALRRPVISTFVAGIPELVVPGENGWLVPPSDVDGLVQAMRGCLQTPAEELFRMGEAARRRALERHNADLEAAKLAGLFRSAIVADQQ
jgi:colanic acid/amylovoran biosynthesis glycosyltransferase